MENYLIGRYIIDKNGLIHNCCVEQTVYSGVIDFYDKLFENMKRKGILDPLDDTHLICLHNVLLPRINRGCDAYQVNIMPLTPRSAQLLPDALQMDNNQ